MTPGGSELPGGRMTDQARQAATSSATHYYVHRGPVRALAGWRRIAASRVNWSSVASRAGKCDLVLA